MVLVASKRLVQAKASSARPRNINAAVNGAGVVTLQSTVVGGSINSFAG